MWKKMEGVSPHAGRRSNKKLRSETGQWGEMGSSSSIEVGQNADRNQLHQVNFQFQPAANRKEERVHSKQASRRVGGKVVMQREKRINQKENNCPSRGKGDADASLEGEHVILLGIKSCLVQKDEGKNTNLQKHTRYSSNADSAGTRPEDQDNLYITAPPPALPKNTDELFREISRRMAEEKESGRVRRTNQNCFFYNLKRKLQREINRIEHQSERNECKLLIEGCEIEKHRRSPHPGGSLTDRVRPKTATPSARPQSSTAKSYVQRTHRPMSCKQSRSQVSQQLRSIQAESRRLLGTKQGKQERSTVRQKECEKKYIMNSLITFDNPNSLKPYKSPSTKTLLNRQKQNQRLNQILNECSSHGADFNNLSAKMRTFQYYCKKMNAGMEQAGIKLNALNEAAEFDD